MLISAILWYSKLRKDLEEQGFLFNSSDQCIANRIQFHVDNLLNSYKEKEVNDEFVPWLNNKYGEHGEVTAHRGNTQEYPMKLEFGNKRLKVNMIGYIKKILEEFWKKFKKDNKLAQPSGNDMFNKDNSKKLNNEERKMFHKMGVKALFLCKQARPDI